MDKAADKGVDEAAAEAAAVAPAEAVDVAPADTALAAGALAFVELGAARGLSRERLMAAAGLTEAHRADPDARVSTFAFVILWRELMTALPGVVLPVELARAMGPEALGVAGQVVLRADDLEHAARLNERLIQLTDTGVAVVREERGELVGFGITHRPEVIAMRFPIELMLGFGYRLLCHAAGAPVPLHEVTFAHPAGFPVAPYEALFGAPVRFGAPSSALWLPRDAMRTPFAGRDPVARRYLEAHAEQLLAALPAGASAGASAGVPVPPVLAQLREAIVVELATSGAELSRVARRVAMSTRTVQRRLEELGTSYQALVDEVRAAMARRLLRDPARSIVDVAFELGYADLRSFYRAFRRWTGTTPADWRAHA
jgi:AraC-like DNA-binding protein